ncbi:LysM peptidoglycan-binding domain-containing protein [Hyalangium minutum]|uniref:LysM peptidoglycan-binding domain-containing protein n=1 Tax=Hyalangium minutum TaxID=394096 RepID=UPI00069434F8|nr:LysM peptidoglycan-binding domain-containing protein [Hyalangium minutum]
MSDYRVRSGDTLSKIARQNKTSVDALIQANNIRDPNRIHAGQSLEIPGGPLPSEAPQARVGAGPAGSAVAAELQRDFFTPAEASRIEGDTRVWADPANPSQTFPSRDGVPLFSQGDEAWGTRRLGGEGNVRAGSRGSIQAQGCAITASAMALSALSGRTITPREMDAYLDENKGYSGNAVKFSQVGGITGGQPPITAQRKRGTLTADGIDQQLDAGRPVLIGVNWRTDDVKTPDHWLTVTGRNVDGSYRANDPNGGREITLRQQGNALVSTQADGAPHDYRFSGQGVTFSGGTPLSPRGNGQDVFVDSPDPRG